jgi:hypothetical protein
MYIYVHMFIKVLVALHMLPYEAGFGYPIGSVIRGFGFGHEFSPESVFRSVSGFKFGFQFWVPRHSTRSEPDPVPSLTVIRVGGRASCKVDGGSGQAAV